MNYTALRKNASSASSASSPALPLEKASDKAGLAADAIVGLELLARSPPLWPAGPETWRLTLAYVRDFTEQWDARVRAVSWSNITLYGIHKSEPASRLSAMGAAWIAARAAHTVVGIEPGSGAIILATRAGSRLRVYRTAPDPDGVLPWLAR